MGSMHTGLEEASDGFARMAAFYATRARGGVGLMVTGGIAPNLSGRLEPKASQLSFPWQIGPPPPDHRRGPRRRRQDRAADPACGALRVSPAGGRAVAVARRRSARFRARGLTRLGRAEDDRRLRALRAARAARRLRRRRDHGLRGLPHQPVRRAADQPPRRRMGRLVRRTASAFRWKSCAARARPRARISSSSIGCRCSTWSKAAARGTRWWRSRRRSRPPARRSSTPAIGWHEARIPTIATMVPRAAFTWVTRRMKGAVGIPLITTNRINDPGDRPKRCSRAATRTWCRWRGRSSPTPISSTRRRRIAPTRSTRASAATRPASTRSSRARLRPASSIRTRAARRCSSTPAARSRRRRSPSSARGLPGSRRPRRRPSAGTS